VAGRSVIAQARAKWNEVRSPAALDREWDLSVKMALVTRDLMVGNPRLAELGYD